MDLVEITRRVSALVHTDLQGATLLSLEVVHENRVELDAVVLWKNRRQCGTHRALVSKVSPNAMLIWGHYYSYWPKFGDYEARQAAATRDARQDYQARIGDHNG